jgi:hypothetical protein
MTDWKEASLEELGQEGYRVGKSIAKSNRPEPVDEGEQQLLNKEIFKENLMDELNDAESNYRCYSPFEFFAKDMNDREDSDAAWEAYDEGISKAFTEYVDTFDDNPIPITLDLAKELAMQHLNELYSVTIAGQQYDAGSVLYQIDTNHFNQIMYNNADSLGLEIV